MAGHVAPEAARGGPIARCATATSSTIDVEAAALDVDVDLGVRRATSRRRAARRLAAGVLAKYAALVSSASEGAITRPPRRGAST